METDSPSVQEPNHKRPRMSSTTDDDDLTSAADRKPRYKRRKIAIFFAYCGVGYQGMQKNPGAKTIEGELEEALFNSGAVPEQDRGCPKRYDWARSARTDKGVSAVGQVVSGRFYVDPPGFIERLNSNLPDQFRIFGFKRATAAFNSKKFCDRRRYMYLLPVFALDPCSHPDRESVLASLGSGNELAKCLECSERGRKVEGVIGKRSFDSDDMNCTGESLLISCHSSKNGNLVLSNTENVSILNAESIDELKDVLESDVCVKNNNTAKLKSEKLEEREANGEEDDLKRSEFCYGDAEKERFNRILKYFEGTHNFHNFTTRTKAEDPSAQRFIISFHANTTVTVDGIEFIKCEVVGQSFMLHQIRKMIGVAVAIMRNCAPESLIETALQKGVNITVPTAPEVGLYLDECFFTSYNKKWKDTHEELSMKDYAEEAEEFKMKYIYSHIAATEHKEGAIGLWLHSLNHRNYPDLRMVDNVVVSSVEEKTGEVVKMEENVEVEKMEKNVEVEKMEENDEVERMEENVEVEKLEENVEVEKLKETDEVEKMEKSDEVQKMEKNVEVEKVEKMKKNGEAEKVEESVEVEKMEENVEVEKMEENVEAEKMKENVEGEKMKENVEVEKLEENVEAEKMEENVEAEKMEENVEVEKMEENVEAEKMEENV